MLRCRIESIYPLVEPLSPMALSDALASGSFGFRLLDSLVAVASGADRLGTIDLPFRDLYNSQGAPSWAVLILFGICKPYRIALLQWIRDANRKGITS